MPLIPFDNPRLQVQCALQRCRGSVVTVLSVIMLIGGVQSAVAVLAADPADSAPQLTQAQSDFFEKKIRPILVQHCYQCHSQDALAKNQLKAGLLLDSRAGVLAGGDSGPAVEPGKPEATLLLEALRYTTFKMPPQGKLPGSVIADFEEWVKIGAPDPRVGPAPEKPKGIDLDAGRQHWSYQPLNSPAIPQVQDQAWPANSIDRYVLAGLEAKGLRPVEEATRLTLVRRLYFDLLGLPPTPEQIDEFVEDRRADAYERLVERLLASPQFGQRWGRHWLDVVRYAESLTLRGFIMPEAWRYRDYVIETFNADRPYDHFLREQVAGDLLPASTLAEKQRQHVATTFLVLGNTNLEEQDKVQLRMDVVDEQLDVITKGFLAQTVTCARCHDHKFDPIPTRDYYALAGILRNAKTLEHANVSKWFELPLPVDHDSEEKFRQSEAAIAELQSRLDVAIRLTKKFADLANGRPAADSGVVAAKELPGIVVDDSQAKKVGEWMFSQSVKPYIGDGYLHDLDGGKGTKTLTFQPELPQSGLYEVRLAYTAGTNRTRAAPITIFSADGERTIAVNQQASPPIDGRFISLGQFRFEQNGQGFVIVANEGTQGHVIADAVQFLPQNAADPTAPPLQTTSKVQPDPQLKLTHLEYKAEASRLAEELQQLKSRTAERPKFMSVKEEPTVEDCAIHIRGTVHNLGEKIPRGFMSIVGPRSASALPAQQSGRRELGDWLAHPDNPLPARVMANRVWHWLLGSGLVRTTDNFGTTGEPPSDPALLDHLATEFRARGWSVKTLVRHIVLSRTYRLASVASPELLRDDPENRLFGRANRRRQDAECLLDTMLSVSGALDRQAGGSTIKSETDADYGYQFELSRRAVYWPVFRNALPELFQVFDYPDPSMVFGRRNTSTVAPQALFLMNSPFVREQAYQTAARLWRDQPMDWEARLLLAYRRILGRPPTTSEREIAGKYLQSESATNREEEFQSWVQFVQAMFGTLDFRYVE